jgi:glycine cleavage system H protein
MANHSLKISRDHVWVRVQEDGALVGISDFAAEALGKIIYVGLPEVGLELVRGEPFATVESGKASIELPTPVSGRVLEVNEKLEDRPDLINEDSLAKGWIARLRIAAAAELNELLSKPDYDLFVAEAGEE